jgi:hypothetical protein
MNRRYVLYAVGIIGLSAAVLSDRLSPAEAVVEPIARPASRHQDAQPPRAMREDGPAARAVPADQILALIARGPRDAGAPGTAFSAHSWAPVASAAPAASEPAAPPALPFSYVGKQSVDGGWQVFIAENDDVRTVKVSDLIDDQYKVLSIDAAEMTLDYLPLHAKILVSIE